MIGWFRCIAPNWIFSCAFCLACVALCPTRTLGDATEPGEIGYTLSPAQQKALAEEANRIYTASLSLDAVDRKEQLERAYDKYQLLSRTGQVSPELFFNLGNCALQLERFGHAIAYFEQARRLAPGKGTIAKNLLFARSKLDPDATSTTWDVASETNFSLSPTAWWIALFAWCVFWLAVGFPLFRPNQSHVWIMKPLRNVALFVFLCSIASLMFSLRYASSFDAIVLEDNTHLRQSDGEVFGINGTVSSGQRVKVLDQRDQWFKIHSDDGTPTSGWVIESKLYRLLK